MKGSGSRWSFHGSPKRHPWIWTLVLIVLLLLLLRLALPSILKSQINQRLSAMDGFEGGVEDVSLSLWRSAYQIEGLTLLRQVDGGWEPILDSGVIDFSLSWGALLEGRVQSEIQASDLHVIYTPVEVEEETADVDEPNWQDVVTDLFPIEIRSLEIVNSRVEYRDLEADPVVDVSLQDLEVAAGGLSNRQDPELDEQLPAWIEGTGTTIGGGRVALYVRAAPLASEPLFDLDLAIEGVDLRALNDYFEAYSGVTASDGTLDFYVEVAAKEGAFEGYVKPLFNDASLGGPKEDEEERGIGDALWEGLLDALVQIFENQPRDQLGSRIPISGEFGETDVDLWSAIGSLLRHAFIEALSQSIEGLSLEETELEEAPVDGNGGETGDEEAE